MSKFHPRPEDSSSEAHGDTHSELSGSAADVVQAGTVHGGVHFYQAGRPGTQAPRLLPGDVRGFVNRVNELERLDRVLTQDGRDLNAVAVSVIAGTAGVGKTSLAIHWAHRVREQFPDGQLYVNLRGYDPNAPITADYALDHFLRALDVPTRRVPADVHAKAALYRSLVADRRILIILDNAATVGQVRPLLPGTASCLVLVTSRSHLPGLVVREGAQRLTLDMLSDNESVALLRTVTADYRREDDPAELAELARLCARLPLALRIAAERAAGRPRMPLSDLIQDLRDESSLWDALSTEDDEEADAVRTVFAWSYRALPAETARMFRLLGLHPGSEFSLDTAAAISGTSISQTRHLLDSLIGANLLEHIGPDRYQFHDLMRAYASDQAHAEESVDDQHAALYRTLSWYLHTAVAANRVAPATNLPTIEPDLPPIHLQPPWFEDYGRAIQWYEIERGNLIAAVRSANATGLDRIAWQVAAVLRQINFSRDPLGDWLEVDLVALNSARRIDDLDGQAIIEDSCGIRLRLAHRPTEAIDHYRAAGDLFRELGDQIGVTRSLNGLGLSFLRERRLDDAITHLEHGLAIAVETNHQTMQGILLSNLGVTHFALGNLVEAERYLLAGAEILNSVNENFEEMFQQSELAEVQRELGKLDAAWQTLRRALETARIYDSPIAEGCALLSLSRLELTNGLPQDSLTSSQRAAIILRQIGYRGYEAQALVVTGNAYQKLGRLEDAAAFYRRSVAVQREIGDRWLLSVALNHLADALELLGKPDDARQAWQEALPLLTEISGLRADTLRAQINLKLA